MPPMGYYYAKARLLALSDNNAENLNKRENIYNYLK